ncbi:hypothetical protein Q7P35_007955 [Cladosporium inversicolor]
MSYFPSSSHSGASHSSHKPKSSYYGDSKSGHSPVRESTTSSSSHRKTAHHESSRSSMDPPPTLRPAHTFSQRKAGRNESSRSTLRPAQSRQSGNDYSFSPTATRHPGDSHTQDSSRHTGATASSRLGNGQLVKTREVKPDGASQFPGSSVSKELMRVPTSGNIAPRSSAVPTKPNSNGQLSVPGSSRRHSTVDVGSEPVEISSYIAFQLTKSDGSTPNVVQGFKIKIGSKSKN